MISVPGTECLGRKILVIGDVNTGKTTLCKGWLNELSQQGLGARIALIDMAPTIPPELALKRGIVGVGGELRAPEGSGVLDLRAHLEPPRLSSSSESEALERRRTTRNSSTHFSADWNPNATSCSSTTSRSTCKQGARRA